MTKPVYGGPNLNTMSHVLATLDQDVGTSQPVMILNKWIQLLSFLEKVVAFFPQCVFVGKIWAVFGCAGRVPQTPLRHLRCTMWGAPAPKGY